jgi:hypothetical protein
MHSRGLTFCVQHIAAELQIREEVVQSCEARGTGECAILNRNLKARQHISNRIRDVRPFPVTPPTVTVSGRVNPLSAQSSANYYADIGRPRSHRVIRDYVGCKGNVSKRSGRVKVPPELDPPLTR